jgi:E3 ubiquitin-protein ligase BAH
MAFTYTYPLHFALFGQTLITHRPEETSRTEAADSTDGPVLRKIEIPLTFDAQFFELLHNDVSSLDAIRAEEEQTLTHDIHKLSKEISRLAKPTRFGKTDMYRWRELFDLYLQAAVFFSTQECNTGSRNPVTAAKQLEWFQSEVTKRGIVASFKRPESHRALTQFVQINIVLLKNLRFQDINKVAVEKILKSKRCPV